jgi:hypothetical protein
MLYYLSAPALDEMEHWAPPPRPQWPSMQLNAQRVTGTSVHPDHQTLSLSLIHSTLITTTNTHNHITATSHLTLLFCYDTDADTDTDTSPLSYFNHTHPASTHCLPLELPKTSPLPSPLTKTSNLTAAWPTPPQSNRHHHALNFIHYPSQETRPRPPTPPFSLQQYGPGRV